jgi:O-antigen/teichoic acid export membrane protein
VNRDGALSAQGQSYEPVRGSVRRTSLRLGFAWTLVGTIAYTACQWAMLVALARLGDPTIVGKFALGLAITTPIMLFASLRLRMVQSTDARREYALGDYIGLRLITIPIALALVALVCAIAGYHRDVVAVILIVGVAKSFESMSDVLYGFMQQQERLDLVARSMILRGAIALIALVLAMALTNDLVLSVSGMAAAWAAILIAYDIPRARSLLNAHDGGGPGVATASLRPNLNPQVLRSLAWLALPLGFALLLDSLSTNVPRFFIERYRGDHELGIFAAMAYLMIAGSAIVTSLGQALTVRLSQAYASGDVRLFRRLLFRLMLFASAVGVIGLSGAIIAGKLVLRIFYGAEYAEHSNIFVWITLDTALAYIYVGFGAGLSAMRRFRVQLPIHLAALIVLLIASPLLIREYGLRGAAWSMLLNGLVEAVAFGALFVYFLRTQFSLAGEKEVKL